MNTIKNICIIALAALFGSACSDFLDVKPVGKLIPTKVSEIENLLNNTSSIDFNFFDNNRGSFYSLLADNITMTPGQAEFMYYETHPNIDRYHAYVFALPYTNPVTTHYFWNWGIYRAAGYFNNTIGGILNLPLEESGSEHAKEVIASAKAARAWVYLQGTLVYGPAYDPAGANDKKVIPYRVTESPLAPNPPLSTVAELFDLVEQDLTDALDAPERVGNPVRAGKTAVLALHAQLYLFKRDWPNALSFADQAWKHALGLKEGDAGKLIYDYNDFEYIKTNASVVPGADSAANWSLRHVGGDADFRQAYNRESLLYRPSAGMATHYPSDEYIALFDPVNDLRYKLFMLNQAGYKSAMTDDGIRRYNLRGSKLINNAGITYPELLLMRAEALVRTGNLPGALADLNTLRSFRYDNSTSTDLPGGSALSADDLLAEILRERRLEQPFESFQRTIDIKRYVYDAGKPWSKTTVVHQLGTQTYSAPVNDEYFTLPIDNPVISLNPAWGLTPNTTPWVPKP